MPKHFPILGLFLLSFIHGEALAGERQLDGQPTPQAGAGNALTAQTPRFNMAPPPRKTREVVVSADGGLEISTMDGEFSIGLSGRIMADGVYYREDLNELGNGTELRSAKFGLEGRLFADYIYEFDVDFSAGDADIKDAWVGYDASYPWLFKLGQFKEPFGLEEQTSRKFITFMERALPSALAPGRNMGLGAHWLGERVSVAAGLFGDDFNDDADNEGDEGWGMTVRATFAPVARDRSALHLGVAASRRRMNDEMRYRVDVRPESHLTDIRYLDTGKIKASRAVSLLGAEAAWVGGPLSLQGEWMHARLDRTEQPDPNFAGWYLQGSWFLTGESRHYKRKKGAFGRIRPLGSAGAVELALRFSRLDLNDLDVEGGGSRQATLGFNWYLNSQLRLMINYVRIDNDRFADADGDVTGDDAPSVIQVRAQVDF